MADWGLLRGALGKVERSVRYIWDELDDLVGGLPPSATNHRAWWSGDRTHVNTWRLAGFGVTDLVLGQGVTFVRHETSAEPVADYASVTPTETAHLDVSAVPTVLHLTADTGASVGLRLRKLQRAGDDIVRRTQRVLTLSDMSARPAGESHQGDRSPCAFRSLARETSVGGQERGSGSARHST